MKIGILTFHRCINYGSYWQSFCLAAGLRRKGHEVVILDHFSQRVNYAEWKCALQPTLPTPVLRADIPYYKMKVRRFFEAFEEMPLSEPFPLEYPEQMQYCDLVLVGSDEVWNLSHPWYGYYPVFYGDGINAAKKIAFAASFGNYDVTWKPDPQWVSKLYNFDGISVRDSNSQTIVNNTLGFVPEMVLDPCLTFPQEIRTGDLPFSFPYVSVYGHNFSEEFINQARKWSENNHIKLISIGYRNHWAHEQWLTAGPFEFAAFMAAGMAVLTNFFHGCVFALINSKPFVCETTPYRSHKIQDLMGKAGTSNRVVSDGTTVHEFSSLLTQYPDETVAKNIATWRIKTGNWLKNSLEPELVSKHENIQF